MSDLPFSGFTYEWREAVNQLTRELLASNGNIQAVEVFGSLARGEISPESDVDLIIIPKNGFDAAYWMKRFADERPFRGNIRSPYARTAKIDRLMLAMQILDAWELDAHDHLGLDVFVFPDGWRQRTSEFRHFWTGWDTQFLANLGNEAIRFDPEAQRFPFPEEQLPAPQRAPIRSYS